MQWFDIAFMAQQLAQPTLGVPSPISASRLNGDQPLSSDERQAYLHYHRQRNTLNRALSKRARIRTRAQPAFRHGFSDLASPSRAALDRFVEWAATRMHRTWGERTIRVLDIGCGSGYSALLLERVGLRGRYVGLDHAEHPRFGGLQCAAFARELIVGDVHRIDLTDIEPFDLVLSMTSLEHFENDAGALERIRLAAGPGAAELHVVPAEDGLRLWEAHGWRQYSAGCVASLCPAAEIYRIGGWASAMLHHTMITRSMHRGRDGRDRRPNLYMGLRSIALNLDQLMGNHPASLYAAVTWPENSR